jgi:hypothetical protein
MRIVSSPDIEFDAIRAPNFSAQVLTGLIKSSIAFGVFDRWFRFRFVNDTLAKINRIPVRDHMGESIRNIAGDMALQAEPILQSVFDTGKVISGFEITKTPQEAGCGPLDSNLFSDPAPKRKNRTGGRAKRGNRFAFSPCNTFGTRA